MKKIRIIPKLEIKNNNLIKGIRYEGLRIVGKPEDYCFKYYKEGADQINIIDIVASLYSRNQIYDLINKITDNIFIPINVGGGINCIEDIKKLLNVGADRIILNSFALRKPHFIDEVANIFGSQFISISIEAKKYGQKYYCMMDHGRENSGILVEDWVSILNSKRVGEIIINSIDHDGLETGYDDYLIKSFITKYNFSVIVSGGAGTLEDFRSVLSSNNNIDGVCASSVFHFNKLTINQIKIYLESKNISIVK